MFFYGIIQAAGGPVYNFKTCSIIPSIKLIKLYILLEWILLGIFTVYYN